MGSDVMVQAEVGMLRIENIKRPNVKMQKKTLLYFKLCYYLTNALTLTGTFFV